MKDNLSRLAAIVGLLAFSLPGSAAAEDDGAMAAEVKKMIQEHDEAVTAHRKLVMEAPREKRSELYQQAPDATPVLEKAREFIEAHPADQTVPETASWVLLHGRSGETDHSAVYAALVTHHLEHPQLALATMSTLYDRSEEASAFADAVLDRAGNPQAKGAAAYVHAYRLRRGQKEDEEKRIGYLRTAIANLGDFEIRGRNLKAAAEGELFAAEHLGIGKPAPEIEGEDTAGVKFKLSDYRGKVVVLDFWGHW